MIDDRPLYAWLIRFRPAPGAPVQVWTRFHPSELEAAARARHALWREYGLDYEIVSIALAAVAAKEERYPISAELAAALEAERRMQA